MKRVKMVLYGAPGTGKSVFACKADKPFFICTDGNYEWLEEFGAKEKDHVNVSSWAEISALINKPSTFDGYETIVVDLLEDAFKWCEQEYCVRNKLEHVSDQGYGKGWDSSRNEFFLGISKLISYDKNIILIMHGITYSETDRRGVSHTKYGPSTRLPDKVVDMIEGKVRYFLRCYVKDVELEDGTLKKERYLSLIPKPNEFGITRGIDESTVPHDIPLEWKDFANVIGLYTPSKETKVEPKDEVKEQVVEEKKENSNFEQLTLDIPTEISMPKPDENRVEVPKVEITKAEAEKIKEEPVVEEAKSAPTKTETSTTASNADRLAAIKAKLEAMKKNKGENK